MSFFIFLYRPWRDTTKAATMMEGLEIELEEVEGLMGGEKSKIELEMDSSSCVVGYLKSRKRPMVISIVLALLLVGILSKAPGGKTEQRFIESVVEDVDLTDMTEVSETVLAEENQTILDDKKESKVTDDASDTPRRKIGEIPAIPLDRNQIPLDESKKTEMIEKWGQWHFWDGDEDVRPEEDYCGKYPNRDIPGDDFPIEAWQVDAVYVNHYLNDADKLIFRAMEAIFTEYGKGKPLPPEKLAERLKMFHWDKLDLADMESAPPLFSRRGTREIGGWTTKRSFDGLVRRLLHAMMTQDTFTVVLAGHSAAMGAGYDKRVCAYHHFLQVHALTFFILSLQESFSTELHDAVSSRYATNL